MTRTALILAVLLLAPAASAQERCTMALLHYNLQYCAGGLEGMADDLGLDSGDFDWSEQAIEDQTIVESLVPVLDLLDAHPGWTMTLEMQGYMLEVIAERHPDVLDQLRALAQGGQAEIASFHYSDQWFLGYPREDLERSIELTQAIFEQHDVPLSGVVFTQEGQFGEGMLGVMEQYGYTTAVVARNLFGTQHDDVDHALFDDVYHPGVDVIVGGRSFTVEATGASAQWTFLDDGELLATNDMNCYLGPLFVHQPEAVAAYEAKVQGYVDQGYRVAGIESCVAGLKDSGVGSLPLPTILDGAWQPEDTDNVGLWMGGAGIFGGLEGTESDNGVLTLGTRAHLVVHAAQQRAEQEQQPAALDEAWRELFLGQVSDATGWNPYRTETEYARTHLQRAIDLAAAYLAEVEPEWRGTTVWFDSSGDVLSDYRGWESQPDFEPPVALAIEGHGREVTTRSYRSTVTDLPVYVVEFAAGEPEEQGVSVTLPWDAERYRGVHALSDGQPVDDSVEDFSMWAWTLPATDGIIGLDDEQFVVLDHSTVHVAARLDREAGTVTFLDETLRADEAAEWHLHFGEDLDEHWMVAWELNNHRPVEITLPGTPPVDPEDCSCRLAGRSPGAAAALPPLALLLLARRRR